MKRVTWIDISDCAKALFDVWVGQPELRWAPRCWSALEARGLTQYETDLERHRVLIRLLALANFYREYCGAAYGETYDEDGFFHLCDEFLSSTRLNPVRVGQLVGEDFWSDDDDHSDDCALLNAAVNYCAETMKAEMLTALVTYFGSPEALFVSLKLSKESEETVCPDPQSLFLAGADLSEVEAWENFEAREYSPQ